MTDETVHREPRGPLLVDTTMFWSATGGGIGRYLRAKSAWLSQNTGWRHRLVAPAHGAAAKLELVDCGGLAVGNGYRLPLARGRLEALLVRQRPDVIEAGDPLLPAWAALGAGQRLAVPTVAFCHGDLAAMASLTGGVLPLGSGGRRRSAALAAAAAEHYMHHVYRRFDLVLAPSEFMAARLRDIGITHARHQPLGVDRALFDPGRRDQRWRRRLQAALGIDADATLLLYVGRFAPEKHLQVLADAVQRLGRGHWLLAVGAGSHPPRGDRVRLLSHEPDGQRLARLVASVDALVHAGDRETLGLAVLEAMACGTPVVARNAAGLAELGRDGAALMVGNAAGASASLWAEVLAALDDGAAGRVALGLQRSAAHEWQRVLPQLLARYRRLLAVVPPQHASTAQSLAAR